MSRSSSRLLRLAPAGLAACELHHLFGLLVAALSNTASGQTHAGALILLAVIGLPVGLLLRETARGLIRTRPRWAWSLPLLATWLMASALLAAALCAGSVFDHGLSAGWVASAPAVLAAGLAVAVSLHGAGWLLGAVTDPDRLLALPRPGPERLRRGLIHGLRASTPLCVGWSDRGPPCVLLPA